MRTAGIGKWLTDMLAMNNFIFFAAVCIVAIGINQYIGYFNYNESVVFNTYAETLSFERVMEIVEKKRSLEWISWILIPAVMILKIVYFTCCTSLSSMLFTERLNLKSNFNIFLKAEVIFSFMLVAKLLSLEFIYEVNTLEDLNIIPLSLLNYFNREVIPNYLHYPVQLLNAWEIVYCVLAVLLLKQRYGVSMQQAIKIFFTGYLPGLLLWVLCVVFLTIQFS